MKGSCLCGGVSFEVGEVIGPFELCHCNRCRKATGSAYASWLEVQSREYRMVQGRELVRSYQAPLIEKPPQFEIWFCSICGSWVPDPHPQGDWVEIPAGLIEDQIDVMPDKHIYVDLKAEWEDIDSSIPKFTKNEILAFRVKNGRVAAQQSVKKSQR